MKQVSEQASEQVRKENQEKLLQSDFESCHTCAHFMSQTKIECQDCKNFSNWTMSCNIEFMD